MRHLTLIRGPSGSGKSTIARHLLFSVNSDSVKHETDDFFEKSTQYEFNKNKIRTAHLWNQLNVERSMYHEIPAIIVSNTFIQLWEMQNYLDLAKQYLYEINIIRTPGPWDANALATRNKHNVPLKTIQKQIDRYIAVDNETEWTDLSIFP